MIVVRNVFRLDFGKAREATALWKEGSEVMARAIGGRARALTDVAGPFYTFVLETTHDSLSDWEAHATKIRSTAEWQAWYARFLPLTHDGHREVWNVVE